MISVQGGTDIDPITDLTNQVH